MKNKTVPGNPLSHLPYALVAGMGRSGIAAARFLKSMGKNVIITDIDTSKSGTAQELEAEGIFTQTGFHNPETFEHADMIIASPGISLNQICFQRAEAKGVPIRGEMDLACEYIREPVIAITGTNGKTTVTTMISQMLIASGKKVFTGGNIGTPLISYPYNREKADIVIVEVSSFQLDTAAYFKPNVAVLLNISEDHLDRYESYKAYIESKWSIFRHQNEEDAAIIQSSIDDGDERIKKLKPAVLRFNGCGINGKKSFQAGADHLDHAGNAGYDHAFVSDDNLIIHYRGKSVSLDLSQSSLKGNHNHENMAAAAMASLVAGATPQGIESVLKNFNGLAHRIQYVATINNVDFYNDSKATNTDAVARALQCFDKNIILIMGGKEKHTDFTLLKKTIEKRVKQIIAMGQTRHKIKEIFGEFCPTRCVDTMEEAVQTAYQTALRGDTVLLSPACASFDMFDSYGDRGNRFMEYVKNLSTDTAIL